MKSVVALALSLLVSQTVFAQQIAAPTAEPAPAATPRPLTHESEVGVAQAAGNSESDTYNVKQITSYSRNLDKVSLAARYLNTSTAGVDTAKNWDGSLRYDRKLSNYATAFTSYGLESDRFAGFVQRNNADLGAHYDLRKTDNTNWFVELGYRYSYTMYTTAPADVGGASHSIRLYNELNRKFDDRTSARLWVEYLPSVNQTEDYRVNLEPSLVTQVSGFLSLKIGYLVKYHSIVVLPATTQTDRLFTTALVAKF